ncbi:hypothetical protein PQD13_gp06 [Gordonia phage Clawz]|uniref:DUF732 domain-containing protein n=1 Tax=Gordonia phage Clawz TaxID=2743910 RepID=A0AAE7F801_9CAUD|nr:hypothetical protein PQD13_gp06 [Gordonia phage Clawz]QKY79918.1 hypothetical protein SEA_CLAWZ_6 [Gordonia phage Clawz]
MTVENVKAAWPYGYYNEDGSVPPEPSRLKVWGSAIAVVVAMTATAIACHPGDTETAATPTAHEQEIAAFLGTPAVRDADVTEEQAKDIAGRGCAGLHQRNAASDSTNITAKIVSVTDEISVTYPDLSPHSIAAIIGAGSVAYCPELTDLIRGTR